MNIEEHVLSKDLAQELWDKGVKVDSYFTWLKVYTKLDFKKGSLYADDKERATKWVIWHTDTFDSLRTDERPEEYFPAPMLSELLNLMPETVKIKKRQYIFTLTKETATHFAMYDCLESNTFLSGVYDPKAVDAVGKTLLWLIDNGYYKNDFNIQDELLL